MARSTGNAVLDAALNHIVTNGTRLDVCATEPTTYTEATSTNSLGNTTLAGGDYTGPVDATSGRKITVGAQSGISVGTSGTADHIAITDGSANLLHVTVLSSGQSVTSGNTMDTSAFEIDFQDPTAP